MFRPIVHNWTTYRNLNILLSAVRAHVAVGNRLERACASLNRYYIPARYPNAFDRGAPVDQFFEGDGREALEDSEEVIRFAEGIVELS